MTGGSLAGLFSVVVSMLILHRVQAPAECLAASKTYQGRMMRQCRSVFFE
ncbi:hypothetical protein RHECNPAF_3340090 [Rhizobium etli CNPAF512]|nr:hypothetical protein RHECNPAF_3340090 [Rhizobium etli CNPAF512]